MRQKMLNALSEIIHEIDPNCFFCFTDKPNGSSPPSFQYADSIRTDFETLSTLFLNNNIINKLLEHTKPTDSSISYTGLKKNESFQFSFNDEQYALINFKIYSSNQWADTLGILFIVAHKIAPHTLTIIKQTITSLQKLSNSNHVKQKPQEIENKFSSFVLNNATEGILIIQNEKIIYVNTAFLNIIERQALKESQSLYELIIPEQIPIVQNKYNTLLNGQHIKSFEIQIRTDAGKKKWLQTNGTLIQYKNNPVILAFIQDITEKENALEQLRNSEKRYRTLVNKTSDIFVEINDKGQQVYVSPVAEKITGYTIDELNRPFLEVIHPNDHERIAEMWQKALDNPSMRHRVEYRHIHKTKGYIWVEAHGQSFLHDPQIKSVYTFIRDISDRKKLEDDLRAQKDKYKLISNNVSDVIWVFNVNKKKFTYISPSVQRQRGYTPEEAMNLSLGKSFTEDSAQIILSRIKEGITAFRQNPQMTNDAIDELQQYCKNGKTIWVEASTRFQNNALGEIEITGVSRDIDDKKTAENTIRESEQKYRKLVETMSEGLIVHNNHEIVSFNNAAKAILGKNILYNSVNIKKEQNFEHTKEGALIVDNIQDAIAHICTLKNIQNHVLGIKEGNEIKWLKISAAPMPHGSNSTPLSLITFDNITLLKEKEAKLKEANITKDRFISIMAHDLKGSFNVILGYTELLNENLKNGDYNDLARMAALTNNSALSAASLLNNLLAWSRSESGKLAFKPQWLSLNPVIGETIDYLEIVAKTKNIKIIINEIQCPKILADRNMLATILRNLISNAIKFSFNNSIIIIACIEENNQSILSVTDNGTGISQDITNKILSADGTISTIGTDGEKGTGLGLSVCKNFVKMHNGKIWFETEKNAGTTFFISFPNKLK